jgi:hypothetical protein
MQVEKLRSLIRESINEYIREIDHKGDGAMLEAKKLACEEAIANREKKVNMDGLDESFHDLISEEKLKELRKEIAELKKFHKKLTNLQEKHANKGNRKKEMTTDAKTDGEAPVEEADVTAEMNMDEEPLNESFIRMQRIAGIIK